MSRGGRPRIEGLTRYASGRIKQHEARAARRQKAIVEDAGTPSPRISQERQLFNAKCFKGGGQGHHAGDAIGQLWLVGQLGIKGYDDTKLLAIAREWWSGREAVFKDVAPKVAQHDRQPQGKASTRTTKAERAYYRYEGALSAAAPYDAGALRDLMEVLDGQLCHWAARVIQDAITSKLVGRSGFWAIASLNDRQLLDAAKRALVVMSGFEAEAMDRAA